MLLRREHIVNRGHNIEIPYLLPVLLSVPFNELPWTPDTEAECGDFYSRVILYACGGASIVVILVTCTLFFVKIGVRNENHVK